MRSALAHRGPSAPNASDGSRTITITERSTQEEGDNNNSGGEVVGSIRVKASKKKPNAGQRVAWGEDVVDNEGCGKKKSKICCIYHKPRAFDESSSEESSSDEDSDSSCGGARPSSQSRSRGGGGGGGGHNHPHNHNHDRRNAVPSASGSQASAAPSSSTTTVIHTPSETNYEPNAYEKQPKGKKKA